MRKSNWTESWWIRKLAYSVVSLCLVIASGAGWITDAQADSWLAQATQIIGVVASVVLGIAATKTHRGSDEDVRAVDIAPPAPPHIDLTGINDRLDELTARLGRSTPDEAPAGAQDAPGDYRLLGR